MTCNSDRQLTDGYVLCQECGHVEEYTQARAEGHEACLRCGAKFCGCACCDGLARLNLQLKIHEATDGEG